MIKLKYRLIGSIDYPVLEKVFNTEADLQAFIDNNKNIVLLQTTRYTLAALNRIYGD